ncbi:MAG: hypothetical protein R3F13_17355 [Prosthecobacter sp.]
MRVGLTTFADGIEEHLPPRNRPGRLRRIITEARTPGEGRRHLARGSPSAS